MHPTQVADRYFAAVLARDIDGFMALFAKDAIFVRPDGEELSGHAAIRAFELLAFDGASPPTPTPVAVVTGEKSFAVEIRVSLPDGRTLRMADFFYLDDAGLIERLSVYRQGG